MIVQMILFSYTLFFSLLFINYLLLNQARWAVSVCVCDACVFVLNNSHDKKSILDSTMLNERHRLDTFK
jgi:hypothetical protein